MLKFRLICFSIALFESGLILGVMIEHYFVSKILDEIEEDKEDE